MKYSLKSKKAASSPQSPRQRFVRRFRHEQAAVAALIVLVLITLLVVFAPLLATHGPFDQDLKRALEGPSSDYLLGSDDLGRDIYTRLLYGGRFSLLAAVEAVAVALALGVLPGLIAGYAGGRIDNLIMRVTDAVMSFPPLILAIAMAGFLGIGLGKAMVGVGIVYAPRFTRLVRSSVISIRNETFVESSLVIGAKTRDIIRRHILPNALSPLVVQITQTLALAMLAEASLSFLGLGVQAPEASWGSMVERGFREIATDPWLSILPGIPIVICVLAFNLLGDGIRDSIGRETRKAK